MITKCTDTLSKKKKLKKVCIASLTLTTAVCFQNAYIKIFFHYFDIKNRMHIITSAIIPMITTIILIMVL